MGLSGDPGNEHYMKQGTDGLIQRFRAWYAFSTSVISDPDNCGRDFLAGIGDEGT